MQFSWEKNTAVQSQKGKSQVMWDMSDILFSLPFQVSEP